MSTKHKKLTEAEQIDDDERINARTWRTIGLAADKLLRRLQQHHSNETIRIRDNSED